MNLNSHEPKNESYGTRVFIPFADDRPDYTNALLHQAKEAFVRQLHESLWVNHWFCVRISQQVRTGFGPRDERGQWVTFTLEFGEVEERTAYVASGFPTVRAPDFKEEGFFRHLWNRIRGLKRNDRQT